MKVVILCGGQGTRLREETEFKPKPLVDIGGRPILWHIMKHYAHYAHREFVLCLGHKGAMLKEYFLNYQASNSSFTINLRDRTNLVVHDEHEEDWAVTCADTGAETNTGGRIKRIERFIDGDDFFCTYGDGVSNVDLRELYAFHKRHGKIATLTGLHPVSKFGVFSRGDGDLVTGFKEKPRIMGDLVSGGFFVFNRKIFELLDEDSVLEKEPFEALAARRELVVYVHPGFWHSMDTYKDALVLNDMWREGRAEWKVWDR